MEVVCAQWCLGQRMDEKGEVTDFTQFIPGEGPVSADQFVDWVLLASYPEVDEPAGFRDRARVAIRAAFVRHMGSESVDAGALRWDAVDVLGRPMLPLPDPVAFARNLTDSELEEYRTIFGEESREWIIARGELARRQGPPAPVRWALLLAWLALLAFGAWRWEWL